MAADRKEQMLAAAYEIVGTEGLEGLHARSVAAKIGVNHAAVHYYFPKRSDLLLAVTAYAVRRFSSDRQKLLGAATSTTVRLDAHLAQAEAYCKPNSRFLKNWISFYVASICDRSLQTELARHLREWSASVGVDIQSGGKTGAVKPASPFANSDLLVATLLGLMVCAQTIGSGYDVGEKLDLIAGSLMA